MSNNSKSTAQLIEQARIGDRDSLGVALIRYREETRRAIESSLSLEMRRRIDIDTVVDQVWTTAFRSISKFIDGGEKEFGNWLNAIAANKVKDEVRKQSRQKRGGDRNRLSAGGASESNAPSLGAMAPNISTPSDIAAKEELHQAITQACNNLNEIEQQIFRRRFYDERAWEGLAEETGRTVPAVRAIYRRSLEKIKAEIGTLSRYLSSS